MNLKSRLRGGSTSCGGSLSSYLLFFSFVPVSTAVCGFVLGGLEVSGSAERALSLLLRLGRISNKLEMGGLRSSSDSASSGTMVGSSLISSKL